MHKLHTFENRLIWLYTWHQQAKKGKTQKNSAQMRHICALFDAQSIFQAKQGETQKNSAQMRHSCALFDALSIFVECAATKRHQQAKKGKNEKKYSANGARIYNSPTHPTSIVDKRERMSYHYDVPARGHL